MTHPISTHLRKMLIGAALFPLFWLLFAFFSFVPFDRQTPAKRILAFTAATYLALLAFLHRRDLLDLETAFYFAPTFTLMTALYSIRLGGEIPPEAAALNARISAEHRDRYRYAHQLFDAMSKLFTSPTREYLRQPHKVFLIKSFTYFWRHRGYVPSHLQAQMYRRLLLASGRFVEDEVIYETSRCFNSPHGYVMIRHPDRPIYADLWAAQNFDEYHFGQLVEMPACDSLSSGPQGEPFRSSGA
jgi:hypothetical protein